MYYDAEEMIGAEIYLLSYLAGTIIAASAITQIRGKTEKEFSKSHLFLGIATTTSNLLITPLPIPFLSSALGLFLPYQTVSSLVNFLGSLLTYNFLACSLIGITTGALAILALKKKKVSPNFTFTCLFWGLSFYISNLIFTLAFSSKASYIEQIKSLAKDCFLGYLADDAPGKPYYFLLIATHCIIFSVYFTQVTKKNPLWLLANMGAILLSWLVIYSFTETVIKGFR